jgi:hypothetical protein
MLTFLLVVLFPWTGTAFPPLQISSASLGIDPNSSRILYTKVDLSGNDIIFYTSTLSVDNRTCGVYKYNASTMLPTLLASQNHLLAAASSNPVLSLLKTELLLSFDTTNASYYVKLSKSNLSETLNQTVIKRAEGLYLSSYDIFVYHMDYEYLTLDPTSNWLPNASRSNPTTYPLKIRHFYTPDQAILLTFYYDQNYFLRRDLINNTNTIISGFGSAQKVFTPGTGVRCVCFDPNFTLLYFVDPTGRLC